MDPNLQVVLAAIASFFFVTLIFTAIILVCKSNEKMQQRTRDLPRTQNPAPPFSNPQLSSIRIAASGSLQTSIRISLDEILTATNHFSPDFIIGDGSFGLVYKASLSDGRVVAIKKLSPDAFQGVREFRAEMETLDKLRHPNIVTILGYWEAGAERLLIYEFIEKGNLDQWLHLHDPSSSGDDDAFGARVPLNWQTRVKIIRGVANGLCFLHGLEKPIIHRDIKASNVLLNSEFEAQIADFGLARKIDTSHSHVSTQFAGTMGYMPPEYRDGVKVTNVKVDVYSFGVLMLETATGRRPNLPVTLGKEEVGLVQWAREMEAQGTQMEMVDSNVSREGLREANVKDYFRIACRCTSEFQKDRPVMPEVAEMLARIPEAENSIGLG